MRDFYDDNLISYSVDDTIEGRIRAFRKNADRLQERFEQLLMNGNRVPKRVLSEAEAEAIKARVRADKLEAKWRLLQLGKLRPEKPRLKIEKAVKKQAPIIEKPPEKVDNGEKDKALIQTTEKIEALVKKDSERAKEIKERFDIQEDKFSQVMEYLENTQKQIASIGPEIIKKVEEKASKEKEKQSGKYAYYEVNTKSGELIETNKTEGEGKMSNTREINETKSSVDALMVASNQQQRELAEIKGSMQSMVASNNSFQMGQILAKLDGQSMVQNQTTLLTAILSSNRCGCSVPAAMPQVSLPPQQPAVQPVQPPVIMPAPQVQQPAPYPYPYPPFNPYPYPEPTRREYIQEPPQPVVIKQEEPVAPQPIIVQVPMPQQPEPALVQQPAPTRDYGGYMMQAPQVQPLQALQPDAYKGAEIPQIIMQAPENQGPQVIVQPQHVHQNAQPQQIYIVDENLPKRQAVMQESDVEAQEAAAREAANRQRELDLKAAELAAQERLINERAAADAAARRAAEEREAADAAARRAAEEREARELERAASEALDKAKFEEEEQEAAARAKAARDALNVKDGPSAEVDNPMHKMLASMAERLNSMNASLE